MHVEVEPAIHYWGTPVVLVSTLNADGSVNVAPMSSAWWLGWSCMLGFDASSQTVINLRREGECVLSLVSVDEAALVDRLALTTGRSPMPLHKRLLGYEVERDKVGRAGISLLPSLKVKAPRIAECKVHLEAQLVSVAPFGEHDPRTAVATCAIEVRILSTHVEESLRLDEHKIDPKRWRPLSMCFRQLFGREPLPIGSSRLLTGDESLYAPWQRGLLMRTAAALRKRITRVER